MSVRRKLFLSMAGLVVSLSLVQIFVATFVVNGALKYIDISGRDAEIADLSDGLLAYYAAHENSWEGIDEEWLHQSGYGGWYGVSFLLVSAAKDANAILSVGDRNEAEIRALGIKHPLSVNEENVGILIYYHPEAANMAKIQYGIRDSVTIILLAFSIILLLASLLAAYWLAKRMTAPLRALVPAIDRLGGGELGAQVPVASKDEYGKVAASFNAMSSQLQRTEAARRSLVADVAHELRTPLTIMQGQLDLLQQQARAAEPHELLSLQDEIIRLSRLVNDLHQLSMAEARKLVLERTPGSLSALLRRIVGRYGEEAEERRLTVALEDRAEGLELALDWDRMTQVFLNLVGNAIRYTVDGGSVVIVIERASGIGEDKGEGAAVSITDTGPGIAPEHLPYIFDRFYRGDEARDRHSGGMGLGLAIAKEFIAAHGGAIEARSRLGAGTTFIVTLPSMN